MRTILLVVALAYLASCYAAGPINAHFRVEVKSLNYALDGTGHFQNQSIDVPIDAGFEATFTDEKAAKHNAAGKVHVDAPILTHLDAIMITGETHGTPKITFSGKFKVSVFDITKPKVPIKGSMKFSNGKEGEALGYIEKFVLEQYLA